MKHSASSVEGYLGDGQQTWSAFCPQEKETGAQKPVQQVCRHAFSHHHHERETWAQRNHRAFSFHRERGTGAQIPGQLGYHPSLCHTQCQMVCMTVIPSSMNSSLLLHPPFSQCFSMVGSHPRPSTSTFTEMMKDTNLQHKSPLQPLNAAESRPTRSRAT
jgi:hypothetical protein